MIKHIVVWNFKEELTDERKNELAKEIKESLEALKSKIDEIVEINVIIDLLPDSNVDVMLDCMFGSVEDLNVYQKHPEHLKVAQLIRSVMAQRKCIDYIV